jgi:hypothetical protein
MSIRWSPRIVVGSFDYAFDLPMRSPDFPVGGVGGSDISAAGFPASYGVRDDYLLDVHLRFEESERANVEELVLELQKHVTTIAFYPDRDDALNWQTCYLDAPARGSRWQPRRESDPGYPLMFELTITLRSIVGAWSINYISDPLES